jgi:glycosyltransferase involved in cell wall biosynthesis
MTTSLKGPIFIMGFPRSGTSGLAAGLSKLPGFANHGPEGHFIYLLDDPVIRIRDDKLNPNSIVRDPASKAAFLDAISKGVDDAYCAASGAASRMWIDKTPDVQQVNAIPAIRALFPDAWFFYIYRDPISAVRSNMATWPAELQGKELEVARRWCQCQVAWRSKNEDIPGEKRLEVFQSDLRKNPEKIVDAIARMLKLSDVDAAPLLQFWTKNRQVNRPNTGDAAVAYDAFSLDDAVADRVSDVCADEVALWQRLSDLAPTTRAEKPGRSARLQAAEARPKDAMTTAPLAEGTQVSAETVTTGTAPSVAKREATGGQDLRAAFTGHIFHNRTQSSGFFIDLIKQVYSQTDRFEFDTIEKFDYAGLIGTDYSHRIFWQSEEILAGARHLFRGRNIVVPMYDAAAQRPLQYWNSFAGDLFISFSAKLHNILKSAGCDSVHVQYWPAPEKRAWVEDAPLSAFFWDRRPGSDYDATHILDACANLGIEKLHIHLAFDFGGDPADRRRALRSHCEEAGINIELQFSEWYESKADLQTAMHAHPVYFAARTHEGIGMSFLEAMAYGQIVIGPNNPTLNEYVANGSNGYLFGPDYKIARDDKAFRESLSYMSARTLDAVRNGHAQWLRDADRLVEILRTGDSSFATDSGAAFERAVRIAAGERAAPRHL